MRGECAILATERHIICAVGDAAPPASVVQGRLFNGNLLKMVEFAGLFRDIHGARA
jgi:hypothetical protein